MRLECGGVILLGDFGEVGSVIRSTVDLRSDRAVHDRRNVLATDRLVGLERMRDGQHHGALLGEQCARLVVDTTQTTLDTTRQAGVLAIDVDTGRRGNTTREAVVEGWCRRQRGSHSPHAFHPRRHSGGIS